MSHITNRNNRIRIMKKDSEKGSVYHCVSRTINKEFLWDDRAKEVLRRQIGKVAEFCGVEILAYCLMSNHFHILVRVVTGRSARLTNEELREKLQNFYTNPDDTLVLSRLQEGLFSNEEWKRITTRKMLLARMDNLSNFMKILKQRFSIWYNRNHNRVGPHWSDRFQSVLVQNNYQALRAVAAYIALNPVRAGICKDPKEYRFSSYTEAVVGHRKALQGLLSVCGERDYQTALAEFRQFVYAMGVMPKADGSGATIEPDEVRKVKQEGGKLPLTSNLSAKARYFTQGVAIGTFEYLECLLKEGLVKLSQKTKIHPISIEKLQAFRV